MLKRKKVIVNVIIDHESYYETTKAEKKDFFLKEIKGNRCWLIIDPKHIKMDIKTKKFYAFVNSQKAVTIDTKLLELIKEAYKNQYNSLEQIYSFFVDEFTTTEDGKIIPTKFKNIELNGYTYDQQYLSNILNYFEPGFLHSHIENEVFTRMSLRAYGFDTKTFITIFLAVLLGIVISYFIVRSGGVDVNAIANVVRAAIQNSSNVTNFTNITTI